MAFLLRNWERNWKKNLESVCVSHGTWNQCLEEPWPTPHLKSLQDQAYLFPQCILYSSKKFSVTVCICFVMNGKLTSWEERIVPNIELVIGVYERANSWVYREQLQTWSSRWGSFLRESLNDLAYHWGWFCGYHWWFGLWCLQHIFRVCGHMITQNQDGQSLLTGDNLSFPKKSWTGWNS